MAIIQSEDERKAVEKENAGQKDVIFSYHAAIGTYGESFCPVFLINFDNKT